MLVAATALAYECPVVTDNVMEFERVEGLTVLAPGW
jgi:predicted nucleic acid-binding protein